MQQELALRDFCPVCEAVLKHHFYPRPKFPVIDVHTHMGKLLLGANYTQTYDTAQYLHSLAALGVVRCCNLDGFWGADWEAMRQKTAGFEDQILNFVWIDTSCIDAPDFAAKTRAQLRYAEATGARGVKIWKDLTLLHHIRTDDTRLDVVYKTAAEFGFPVLMHIADPTAFFKPADARNERYEELIATPNWCYTAQNVPGFEELMQMQDNTIARHPDTTFVIAHVGSYAENLAHVARRLERFANMYVDIAARAAELGRVPYSARRFFLDYRDRILFGSDCTPLLDGEHSILYRLLESEDEYFPHCAQPDNYLDGRWCIYGLHLPDDVLRRVYHENAASILHLPASGRTG